MIAAILGSLTVLVSMYVQYRFDRSDILEAEARTDELLAERAEWIDENTRLTERVNALRDEKARLRQVLSGHMDYLLHNHPDAFDRLFDRCEENEVEL